ncbi:hypothetical protein FOA52_006035 [Chlamydomonas sp. UWO 241]|nr:hypothetical protein FOA52_006035 [Chlamydomonas sp. UWO 241]
MPLPVLLRCSVSGELQEDAQMVKVTRPEPGGGRLAMRILEPMLSLIKSHMLATCTLEQSSSAELPVLTMVLVKKSGDAASPPPAATQTRPAAALEPSPVTSVPMPAAEPAAAHEAAPVSAPAAASARRTTTAGAAPADTGVPRQVKRLSSQHDPAGDLLQPGSDGGRQLEGSQAPHVRGADLLEELDGYGTPGYLSFTAEQTATLFGGQHVQPPVAVLLRCSLIGVLQPNVQRAVLKAWGQCGAKLCVKDPMLSLMKGRSKLSSSCEPPNGGYLPEMMLELGEKYFPHHQQAPGKRRAADTDSDAETVSDSGSEAPPLKKGRSHQSCVTHPTGDALDFARVLDHDTQSNAYLGTFGSEEEAAHKYDRASIVFYGTDAKLNIAGSPWLTTRRSFSRWLPMVREDMIVRRDKPSAAGARAAPRGASGSGGGGGTSGGGGSNRAGALAAKPSALKAKAKPGAAIKYRGVEKDKRVSGSWWRPRIRKTNLGMFDTNEDAARVYDYAVLSLFGVDTERVINFGVDAYVGDNGELLPVEAALRGLSRDERRFVRAALATEPDAHEGAGEGGSDSDSDIDGGNDGSRSGGGAHPGTTAVVNAQAPASRRGLANGGVPSRDNRVSQQTADAHQQQAQQVALQQQHSASPPPPLLLPPGCCCRCCCRPLLLPPGTLCTTAGRGPSTRLQHQGRRARVPGGAS